LSVTLLPLTAEDLAAATGEEAVSDPGQEMASSAELVPVEVELAAGSETLDRDSGSADR